MCFVLLTNKFFLSLSSTIAIYVAPEIMMNDRYDEKADVYSFAICLIAMIRADDSVVKFFFNGLRKEMRKKTMNGIGIHVLNNRLHNRGFRPKLPESLYPSLAKLITDCWSAKGDDRPSFTEIVARLRREITMEVMLCKEPDMAEADEVLKTERGDKLGEGEVGLEEERAEGFSPSGTARTILLEAENAELKRRNKFLRDAMDKLEGGGGG